jgi:periplasmic divalent cation tolerance protein
MADVTQKYAVVFITTSSYDEACSLAEALVKERLAACVSIIDRVRSTYTWQGTIERADESLLMCKTRSELFSRLEARVHQLHSYETPEIIQTGITDGSAAYFRWMDENLLPVDSD